jgi:adenine-specific DNA-methyltransferase
MSLPLFQSPKPINDHFNGDAEIVLFTGDIRDLLTEIPDQSIQLIITSPPYNLGKDYESRVEIEHYLEKQAEIIAELYRVMKDDGSLCWQWATSSRMGKYIRWIFCITGSSRSLACI